MVGVFHDSRIAGSALPGQGRSAQGTAGLSLQNKACACGAPARTVGTEQSSGYLLKERLRELRGGSRAKQLDRKLKDISLELEWRNNPRLPE